MKLLQTPSKYDRKKEKEEKRKYTYRQFQEWERL